MRTRLFLLLSIVGILLLTACGESEIKQRIGPISAISDLTNNNPADITARLDSLAPLVADAKESDRMYYLLARMFIDNHKYKPDLNDSIRLLLTDYYANHGDDTLRLHALYCIGSSYRYAQNCIKAIECFQKAWDMTTESGKDYPARSSIMTRMGFVYTLQHMPETSNKCLVEADKYGNLLKDTVNRIYVLCNLGYNYDKIGQSDSSLYYFKNAYQLALATGSRTLVQSVKIQMAPLYLDNGDYAKAQECIDEVKRTVIQSDTTSIRVIQMKIYMGTGKRDSAKAYAASLMCSPRLYVRQSACRIMMMAKAEEGDATSIPKLLERYKDVSDSIDRMSAKEAMANATALYNYNTATKKYLMLEVENKKGKASFWMAVAVVMIMSFLTIWYIAVNRKKKKQQQKRMEYLSSKIENLELRMKAQNINKTRGEQISALLSSSDSMEIITRSLKDTRALNATDMKAIEATLNQFVDDFKQKIEEYRHVNMQEFHICLLLRYGIKGKEIASLMAKSPSTISKKITELRMRFLGEDAKNKDFMDFLLSIQ